MPFENPDPRRGRSNGSASRYEKSGRSSRLGNGATSRMELNVDKVKTRPSVSRTTGPSASLIRVQPTPPNTAKRGTPPSLTYFSFSRLIASKRERVGPQTVTAPRNTNESPPRKNGLIVAVSSSRCPLHSSTTSTRPRNASKRPVVVVRADAEHASRAARRSRCRASARASWRGSPRCSGGRGT